MAFLRIENKKSGTYLRIVQSYKEDGKAKHRTLYSLGKKEDYSDDQLASIANKLLGLIGKSIDQIITSAFIETGRYNYGYALVIHKLWSLFQMDSLVRKIQNSSRVQFDWVNALKIMVAERINEPGSKRQCSFNQSEYVGFADQAIDLHHFYRTLDILGSYEQKFKHHLFNCQRNLFSEVLDVVFYDVTTLYFDSQVQQEDSLRQKGYSKDGKAHKTQIVLGLLVDKLRNPISYEIYQGNTYEGATMVDALKTLKKLYKIDQVIVVADSAMIDEENRLFMVSHEIDYIIGDRLKSLGKKMADQLINRALHKEIGRSESKFTFTEVEHKGRRIICTYSPKRAAKDAFERQKLIDKANKWLNNPSQYKQVKKRGAGRFITSDENGVPIKLDHSKIEEDEKYDGFKAISTTTKLPVEQILAKYNDLFEVEHAFRTLKSQLEIRPMFHWTDKRIKGHVCMCFIAFIFMNFIRNKTNLQYKVLIKTLDNMQFSSVLDNQTKKHFFIRSAINSTQQQLTDKLNLNLPPDATTHVSINQYIR